MPKIERLRNYPVAGMEGFDVDHLTITPEAITGNRLFAVVTQAELAKLIDQPNFVPLRLTQVSIAQQTPLLQFQTRVENDQLVLLHPKDSIVVNETTLFTESPKPFYTGQAPITLDTLLTSFAFPLKVSRRSNSKRWAIDCGNDVADWLTKHMGVPVRLVKAVAHPEAEKHHFTWYTDIHAITQASLWALSQETATTVDDLSFRYNVLLSGTEPFEETRWESAYIRNIEFFASACKRCGYIGIDRVTGLLAQHMKVLTTLSREHETNFGVYIKPKDETLTTTVHIGDEVTVSQT